MSKITIHCNPPVDEHAFFKRQLNSCGLSSVGFESKEEKEPWEEEGETLWILSCSIEDKDNVVEQLNHFFIKEGCEGSCQISETKEIIELG